MSTVSENKDKLWVFDSLRYLEIEAPTLEEALKQVNEITRISGLEFDLVREWENYQQDSDFKIKRRKK
jgi:hypothetical protein|tara:strand:+ start:56 stop:259 length:204 start_codon:yes stop_codon:yes gene_type:complete